MKKKRLDVLIFVLLFYQVIPTYLKSNGLTLSERMALDVDLSPEVEKCRYTKSTLYKVPNIVHYIWFGCTRKFTSYNYISVLSALSVQKACIVFFHTNCEPPKENEMFQKLKTHSNFRVVKKDAPTQIFGHEIVRPEHQADVARIELLLRYGGIYLDDTVIVTKDMAPLRQYTTTLPFEKTGVLMNGVIVAEENSAFLKKWLLLGYQDFEDARWAWNSCRKPYLLWKKYPGLLHIERDTFMPSWDQWEYFAEDFLTPLLTRLV